MDNYDVMATTAAAAGLVTFLLVFLVVMLIFGIFMLFCNYKLFIKAGYYGWKAIIPFYNMYIMTQFTLGNGWLILLTFVPLVNFVFLFYLYYKLGVAFRTGVLMLVALFLFPYIALPVIALSKSYQYQGDFPGYDI